MGCSIDDKLNVKITIRSGDPYAWRKERYLITTHLLSPRNKA